MSRLCNLFSSSKGNCTWLAGGDTAVLVDAGISYRSLTGALRAQDLSTDQLQAVLVTHEHTDHIKGLRTLLTRLGLPVYASTGTLECLVQGGYIPPGTTLVECNGAMTVGDLSFTAFSTPHDARDPVGFRIQMPDGRTVAVATDLGHITDEVRAHLSGCDLVMLESNYDKRMLECSRYPYYLKRRIKSSIGHLSNEDCSSEILSLVKNGTTRLVLAHLSEENNLPEIAYRTVKNALGQDGIREDYDYILRVAPAHGPQEVLVF